MTLNLALPEFGRAALDPFPFPLLAAVVSTIALYLAAMILMTQRHDDEMATRREQITLELAILSEQKSSKIIALLEEFRRNDPNQGDQRDEVAEALAEPADAQVVLDAIRAAERRRTTVRRPRAVRARAWLTLARNETRSTPLIAPRMRPIREADTRTRPRNHGGRPPIARSGTAWV